MFNTDSIEVRQQDGTLQKIALNEKNPLHRQYAFEIEKKLAEKSDPTMKLFYESANAQIFFWHQ